MKTCIRSMMLLLLALAVPSVVAAPPLITIDPIPDQVFEGVGTFTYQASYSTYNPECLARVTFSLDSGPSGMTVSSSGYISWTGPGWGGNWDVTIKAHGASDCLGVNSYTDYESFTLYCVNNC